MSQNFIKITLIFLMAMAFICIAIITYIIFSYNEVDYNQDFQLALLSILFLVFSMVISNLLKKVKHIN